MIKIRLSDNQNMKCFSGLIISKDMLKDYSIDITDSDDYDYEFIVTNEFVKSSLPLKESIDWGLENLSKKSGDYFLFHGGDSTSIMGAYEVFIESNAKYLFKKQLLSQEDYREETTLNKWFFGKGKISAKMGPHGFVWGCIGPESIHIYIYIYIYILYYLL